MMLKDLNSTLPHIPKDERVKFILKIVKICKEKGTYDFTNLEKKMLLEKLAEKLK